MADIHILIVEDEVMAAEGLKWRLERLGYRVAGVAYSGEDAIRQAEESSPDLVLMDIGLNGPLDGVQAAKTIREHLPVPIIYITAYADDDTLRRVSATEPFACLLKPINERELRSAIEIALIRSQMERRLRAGEQRHWQLLDSLNEGVWVIDRHGCTTYVNPCLADMLGYTPAEMLGRHLFEFMDERQVALARELLQRREQGFREQHEFVFARRDGTELIALLGAAPLRDDEGGYAGSIASVQDIGQLKRAEEQLRAALAEKEVLLREIHHRVKNNLQIVSSLLQQQARLVKDPHVQAAFQESQSRIQAMSTIHELLYRSSNLAQIDIRHYMSKIVTYLVQSYGAADLSVTTDVADISLDIDTAIYCGLILQELVWNAMKHAFPPGREQPGAVHVGLQADGATMTLTVSDNGVGVPPDLDLFGAESLGLRLVAMLARQLRGTVHVTGGQGSTFTVTVPWPRPQFKAEITA